MAPSWRWPGQWGFAGWISPQRDISFLLLLFLVVFISSMCADFFFFGCMLVAVSVGVDRDGSSELCVDGWAGFVWSRRGSRLKDQYLGTDEIWACSAA